MIIYIGGYCIIIPEWRYLWLIFILLMFSGFFIIDRLYKSNVINYKNKEYFVSYFDLFHL